MLCSPPLLLPHLLPPSPPPPFPLQRNSLEEPLVASGRLLKNTMPPFAISKEMHHIIGLGLLLLLIFQVANGFLGPLREIVMDDGTPGAMHV